MAADRFAVPAPRTVIGQPMPRKEDLRLLTGKGRYSDDFTLPGQAYGCVLRSPHAPCPHRARSTPRRRAPCRACWRC